MEQAKIEQTGASFSRAGMLEARRKTWDAIEKIRSAFKPGLPEADATKIADDILQSMGCTRKWHRSLIRFGENTLLPYSEISTPGVKLQENDICFLDLGPVFDGFEADCGAAFAIGNREEHFRCATDVKRIFDRTKERWQKGFSGKDLYAFALEEAKALGWILNLKGASGHRLSDFPHAIYHKGSITTLDFKPSELLWVLEIQIRHPEQPFGAFYEDLLVND